MPLQSPDAKEWQCHLLTTPVRSMRTSCASSRPGIANLPNVPSRPSVKLGCTLPSSWNATLIFWSESHEWIGPDRSHRDGVAIPHRHSDPYCLCCREHAALGSPLPRQQMAWLLAELRRRKWRRNLFPRWIKLRQQFLPPIHFGRKRKAIRLDYIAEDAG